MRLVALTALAAAVGALALTPSEAVACGGCFVAPSSPTVVSGHRMVMSVSTTQSTLWDQIQYAGEPEEFAWVLPVKPGARIEAGSAAFFEVLEATTRTEVQPPPVQCVNNGGGLEAGCSSADFAGAEAGDGDGTNGAPPPAVEVVHQGTVGPYETVTLSTEQPGALNEWLDSHGYAVDDSTQPIIDQYVAEGFDFIALRLLPGKGVKEMTPVRVVADGGNLSLPLRMVAAGTGAETPIVLYVIGEGRYTVANFSEVAVESALVSWDFRTSSSNYEQLRLAALAKNDGRSFLTSFAARGHLTGESYDEFGGRLSTGQFADLYAQQAFANGETTELCRIDAPSGGGVVRNPCPPGEPWDSPACMVDPAEGGIDARLLGCEGLDDLAVALEGIHLSDAWVTRLEGVLPRAALATDLQLRAADRQTPVSSVVDATIAIAPEEACGGLAVPVTKDIRLPPVRPNWLGFYALALGAAGLAYALRRVTPRATRR